MLKTTSSIALFALTLMCGTAVAQVIPGPGGGPGGGASSGSGSGGSHGGAHGRVGGAIAFSCIVGAAVNTGASSISMTGGAQQRQLTKREAWVAAWNGCVPVVGGIVAGMLVPQDTREDYEHARLAARYDELPWRQQDRLLRIGAKEEITYPSAAEMKVALGIRHEFSARKKGSRVGNATNHRPQKAVKVKRSKSAKFTRR